MIVAEFVAFAVAVLVFTAWAIDHLHLPLDLAHTLAAQVVTAIATVILLTELGRVHARRSSRTTTTNGDTHR